MRIAIASSGLGHVARGIETWAADTASTLHQAGSDVTLFSADDKPAQAYEVCLPCWRRDDRLANRITKAMPGFSWRWGLKSKYGVEQFSFWLALRKQLKQKQFDILHVQDPMLAFWCNIWRRKGWLKTREILGHGTEEPGEFLRRFPYVQQLAPWHLEQSQEELGEDAVHYWRAIPNFVDTKLFKPEEDGQPNPYRSKFHIPEAALVLVSAAALKRHHKRCDIVIEAFGKLLHDWPSGQEKPWLLMAGAATDDTPELRQLADACGEGHIQLMTNLPRSEMPDFLRAGSAFVLGSLFEMMPIALLEALATGLPLLVNNHPVMNWMAGKGGMPVDITTSSQLASAMQNLLQKDKLEELSSAINSNDKKLMVTRPKAKVE